MCPTYYRVWCIGTSLKYAAVYTEGPWWREHGFQGDILATSLPRELSIAGSRIPLFVQCQDHSPYSRKYGVINCFLEGRQNLYFATLTDAEREEKMKHFLNLTFSAGLKGILPTLPTPAFFVAHDWSQQEFYMSAHVSACMPTHISTRMPVHTESAGVRKGCVH